MFVGTCMCKHMRRLEVDVQIFLYGFLPSFLGKRLTKCELTDWAALASCQSAQEIPCLPSTGIEGTQPCPSLPVGAGIQTPVPVPVWQTFYPLSYVPFLVFLRKRRRYIDSLLLACKHYARISVKFYYLANTVAQSSYFWEGLYQQGVQCWRNKQGGFVWGTVT